MKKAKRHMDVRDQAYYLAESGKYTAWLQIEQALINMGGYRDVKSALEPIHQDLDERCGLARSLEEKKLKEEFADWIQRCGEEAGKLIHAQIVEIRTHATNPEQLFFSTEKWSLVFKRVFCSSNLHVEHTYDDREYFDPSFNESLGGFHEIDAERLATIVIKLYTDTIRK